MPSFISACEVSCRVRAERVKPYASSLFLAGDSPRGPLGRSVWVPRLPAPPGARRLGILLSTTGIRLATAVVNDRQRRRLEVYSLECVEGKFFEVRIPG